MPAVAIRAGGGGGGNERRRTWCQGRETDRILNQAGPTHLGGGGVRTIASPGNCRLSAELRPHAGEGRGVCDAIGDPRPRRSVVDRDSSLTGSTPPRPRSPQSQRAGRTFARSNPRRNQIVYPESRSEQKVGAYLVAPSPGSVIATPHAAAATANAAAVAPISIFN